MKHYDLIIIGAGPAGVLAARTTAAAGLSVLLLEKGAKPTIRRDLACGWFGHGLHALDRLEGNGHDIPQILDMCRTAGELDHRCGFMKDGPGMRLLSCDHYRMSPHAAYALTNDLYREVAQNTDILFRSEVQEIECRSSGDFAVSTDRGVFSGRRCLLATGSRSAEWVLDVCGSLGLPKVPPPVRLGTRIEMPMRMLKRTIAQHGDMIAEYEKVVFDDLRFGGFVGEWDDFGMISAFGHTMPGKKSERANFMAGFKCDRGFAEALRTMRIINVLSNDKVRRERVQDFAQGKSVLRHIPQFSQLVEAFAAFERLVPRFLTTAAMYIPEARIGGTLSTDSRMKTALPGFYGAGQCVAGTDTLLEAMASGMIAARSIMEDKDDE